MCGVVTCFYLASCARYLVAFSLPGEEDVLEDKLPAVVGDDKSSDDGEGTDEADESKGKPTQSPCPLLLSLHAILFRARSTHFRIFCR